VNGKPWRVAMAADGVQILVADSVTQFDKAAANQVLVCGSHGGVSAALYAADVGALGVILNDAGVGKESAGIAGLTALEPYAIAAATVGFESARIGDGNDTLASGEISHVNRWARTLGVHAGMHTDEAAQRMARRSDWDQGSAPHGASGREHPRPILIEPVEPAVIAVDSVAQMSSEMDGAIVLTGSHGGVVSGHAVKAAVFAAFFNDAGVGKNDAGVGRLALLDSQGIAGATVDCWSARIGDGLDTYRSGVVSRANTSAARMGLSPQMSAVQAVVVLREAYRARPTPR
jgi:hypothetical protein